MRKILFIFSLVLLSSFSNAAPIHGLDLLGAARFESEAIEGIKSYKRSYKDQLAIGVFSEVFGDALPFVKKAIRTGAVSAVRFQLAWQDNHNFNGQKQRIIKEAKRVARFIRNNPGVKYFVSPMCEHTLKTDDALDVLNAVAQIFGDTAEIVNTPWVSGGGAIVPKYINEIHGNKVSPPSGRYFYSYDGQSSVDANRARDIDKYSKAEYFFDWIVQFNCKMNEKDTTPRDQRKACPSKTLIDSVSHLRTEKGETTIKAPRIVKTHAEQHQVPPAERELKLMVILKEKGSEAHLVTQNKKVIAKASYYGTYEGGLHRYYFYKWGYQLARQAEKMSGDPVVTLKVDNQTIGTMNPAFRDGVFR